MPEALVVCIAEKNSASWIYEIIKFEIECVLPDKRVLAHNQCGVCGRQSGAGMGFIHCTSVSSVSIIPPVPHTHSFICTPHYVSYS